MKDIVSLAKRRGFVFPSSEIYGGVEALWDYGPLGAALKNNIRREWLKTFVQKMENVELLDASVLMHPKVWEASGHVEHFSDPMVDCKNCKSRLRADHLDSNQCPECGGKEFTEARQFNLMFSTFLGPVQDEGHRTYLRPEAAQSMFADFRLVQEAMRQKLPFGIAQVGKAFRNEITTGNFIFRSREFDIAEIEFFVKPGEDEQWFDYWVDQWEAFFLSLGLRKENLRRYEHPKEALSHYSKRTVDLEYKFPFGWKEIAGIANRTDYDLKRHAEFSGQDLSFYDEETKEKVVPYVVEPTLGLERALLAILCDAYEEVKGGRTETTEAAKEKEVVLRLAPRLAPVQVAVYPLVRNKPELVEKAREVFGSFQKDFWCRYDETGSIGRRYRRGDEIGVPLSITVDFDSLKGEDVTVRDRDTMKQERIAIAQLGDVINKRLSI